MTFLRNTPLIALRDEGKELTPALWYALGVASVVHSFADPARLPLHMLAGRDCQCRECNVQMVVEGLVLQLDMSHLQTEGLNLIRVVLRTALAKHGYAVELHSEPRLHLAVYGERAGAHVGMNLPVGTAASFDPNTQAATIAGGGGLSSNSVQQSRRSQPSRPRLLGYGKKQRAAKEAARA
jgi:hypothetical protein